MGLRLRLPYQKVVHRYRQLLAWDSDLGEVRYHHTNNLSTKSSRKQGKTWLSLLDHNVTTGSTSMLTNSPHLLKNAIKYSMLSAPPLISPPPSLIPCMSNSGVSTKMSKTKCFLLKHAGLLTYVPRSTTCPPTHVLHGNTYVSSPKETLPITRKNYRWP